MTSVPVGRGSSSSFRVLVVASIRGPLYVMKLLSPDLPQAERLVGRGKVARGMIEIEIDFAEGRPELNPQPCQGYSARSIRQEPRIFARLPTAQRSLPHAVAALPSSPPGAILGCACGLANRPSGSGVLQANGV